MAGFGAEAVERIYVGHVYPLVVRAMSAFAWLPFSAGEWLAAAAAACATRWIFVTLRAGRARWARAVARVTLGLLGTAGWLYLVFLLVWGLSYQRQPFATLAGLDTRPAAAGELLAVTEHLVSRANQLREGLPEDVAGVMLLPGGVSGAAGRASLGFASAAEEVPTLAGPERRVKTPVASVLLWRMGIAGIFNPFTGEANVNHTLPHPDIPFAASHELAHQRGFAREDEANFLGYLACSKHADRDFQYSGALAASLYALRALSGVDREAARRLNQTWAPAVRRDLEAIRSWQARTQGVVGRAARAMNDAYLRSQGQVEGIRSYGRMVDLLIAEHRQRGSDDTAATEAQSQAEPQPQTEATEARRHGERSEERQAPIARHP